MVINNNTPNSNENKRSLETIKEDNCKEFRTSAILCWLMSNCALVGIFLIAIQIAVFTNNGSLDYFFPKHTG